MRPRLAVLAAILALAISNPYPALSKGKKPDAAEDEEYNRIQEEMMAEQERSAPSDPAEPDPAADADPAPSRADAEAPPEPDAEAPQKTYPPQETINEAPAAATQGGTIAVVWVWQESKDCLWNLAKKHYDDPWKWKKIYLDNRNAILDPGVIFPKQRIVISPLETTAQ